jgi:hypothetical protein
LALHASPASLTRPPPLRKTKISSLLRELSDEEDDCDADVHPGRVLSTSVDEPAQPWLRDFRAYLDTSEHVPDNWTAVTWWGVSIYSFSFHSIHKYSRSTPIDIQSGRR